MTYDMYQQNILDHAKHPRHSGTLGTDAAHVHRANPLCGDEVDMYVMFDDQQRVKDVAFTGRGCTISQAAASMLTEHLRGKSKNELAAMTAADMTAILGVPINPARLSCATLGLQAAQEAGQAE